MQDWVTSGLRTETVLNYSCKGFGVIIKCCGVIRLYVCLYDLHYSEHKSKFKQTALIRFLKIWFEREIHLQAWKLTHSGVFLCAFLHHLPIVLSSNIKDRDQFGQKQCEHRSGEQCESLYFVLKLFHICHCHLSQVQLSVLIRHSHRHSLCNVSSCSVHIQNTIHYNIACFLYIKEWTDKWTNEWTSKSKLPGRRN